MRALAARLVGALRPRRPLCVIVREDALYWVEAHRSREGSRPVAWGRVPRTEGQSAEEQLDALAERGFAAGARLEVTLRSPDLVHKVVRIPAMSRREVASLAERRAELATGALDVPSCFAHARGRPGEPGPLWLVAAPLAFARRTLDWWSERGLEVDRLGSQHLALGNLARALPRPAEGELLAIVDLESEDATCVLADASGWVFGRDVPLRFLGRRTRKSAPQQPAGDGEDESIPLADASLERDHMDPLELVAERAELLITELRRTFHYVEGELASGSVRHVYLAGASDDLEALAGPVSHALALPVSVLSAALAEVGLQRAEDGASVAIGLALSPDRDGENLVPADVMRAREARRARMHLVAALVSALVVLSGLGLAIAGYAQHLASHIRHAETRWEADAAERALAADVARARERTARIREVHAAIDRPEPPWTGLLRVLGRAVPSEAAVHRLLVLRDGEDWTARITVESGGESVAEAASAVSALARMLDESPLAAVDAVERDEARTGAADSSRPSVRFRIEGRLATVRSPAAAPVAAEGPGDG